MAASEPQYHETKAFDFPPDAILLGSIIKTPKYPDEALNQGEIVPITPPPTPLVHHNWKDTVENVKKGKAGFFARFAQFVSLGAEAGASGTNEKGHDYSFEKLETVSFFPTPAYTGKAIETPQMKMWLKGAQYPPVFMVTGVKVVRGANSTVKTNVTRAREAHVNVGVSATVFTVPVTVGPEAKGSTFQKQVGSFGGPPVAGDSADMTDYVIAYRLRKLTFEEKDGTVKVDSEYYLNGDGNMMGADGDSAESGDDSGMVVVGSGEATEEELKWDRSD
jgi:hypothetical protein